MVFGNRGQGFSGQDDAGSDGGCHGCRGDMLKAYYEMRYWDQKTDYPAWEKLAELGLEEYLHFLPS